MSLKDYRRKRNFDRSPEPRGANTAAADGVFVVQKHDAQNLHYDFRLEINGVLKSWAVPKGPSLNPSDKRLAVQTEDHPIEYAEFEGEIPKGEYGGGTVMVWDRGHWQSEDDAQRAYRAGHLRFRLTGQKLNGVWSLIRMKGHDDKQWLLIKARDEFARGQDIRRAAPLSVLSQRSLTEIRKNAPAEQTPKAGEAKTSNHARRARRLAMRHAYAVPSVSRRGKPPGQFRPQLATLHTSVPETENWIHEIKYDGYRLLTIARDGHLHLMSRNGQDWTDRLPSIATALRGLKAHDFLIDGELVARESGNIAGFQALQNALHRADSDSLLYYAFDLPFFDGLDLRNSPLLERKALLERVIQEIGDPRIRYSAHLIGNGAAFLSQACAAGLEGIVSKHVDAGYQSRRSRHWLKIKCSQRQEFVIGGYTEPSGARHGFGALLLGYFDDDGHLRYSGRVGTGFTNETLDSLGERLRRLKVDTPAFVDSPRAAGVHWCRPELVAEIAFTGWTRDQRLRHPSFLGLRADKPARDVRREQPLRDKNSPATKPSVHGSATSKKVRQDHRSGVILSHPDRVMFPRQGITKRALADYYTAVAEWILPGLRGRPLSLLRCPRGRGQQCFFQRHLTESLPDAVHGVEIKEKESTATYIVIHDLPGLISLVQHGTLEFHPWAVREQQLDHPDYMVFDLDPAADIGWSQVVVAARELRAVLQEHKLESFVRTTGGKGLHVLVPLAPDISWDRAHQFSKSIAQELVRRQPRHYVATASKSKRHGKIFIDYLRNLRGATSIANFSTRSHPGAPVAVPITWEELSQIKGGDHYTLKNVRRRLAALREDPWDGFDRYRQSLPEN